VLNSGVKPHTGQYQPKVSIAATAYYTSVASSADLCKYSSCQRNGNCAVRCMCAVRDISGLSGLSLACLFTDFIQHPESIPAHVHSFCSSGQKCRVQKQGMRCLSNNRLMPVDIDPSSCMPVALWHQPSVIGARVTSLGMAQLSFSSRARPAASTRAALKVVAGDWRSRLQQHRAYKWPIHNSRTIRTHRTVLHTPCIASLSLSHPPCSRRVWSILVLHCPSS
jgi:hypothetical protein